MQIDSTARSLSTDSPKIEKAISYWLYCTYKPTLSAYKCLTKEAWFVVSQETGVDSTNTSNHINFSFGFIVNLRLGVYFLVPHFPLWFTLLG